MTSQPAPAWDFHLRKRLQHGTRVFTLDVQCRSDTRRLVLFGPSGAGKTQTLKMIAGLVRPDGGHVRIDGHAVYDSSAGITQSPQARKLAYVFQDYALFPHLTVRQNVAFALHRGWRNPVRDTHDAAVERWLETFGLTTLAQQYPHQLSGGQQQRTALARALVTEPRALLLDEPFAALDRPLRRQLRQELRELQMRLSIPTLLITHDEEDVAALGDASLHLDAGTVVSQDNAGPPQVFLYPLGGSAERQERGP